VIVLAAGFAALVLGTSMPWSLLVSQRTQLSSTETKLQQTEAQNRVLSDEAKQLSNPSDVANIARSQYGLVSPGSQAYEILPAPGSSQDASTSTGHVPLDGPLVTPGSARSQELLGAGSTVPTATPAGSGTSSRSVSSQSNSSAGSGTRSNLSTGSHPAQPSPGASSTSGFWGRVVDTLEFWR
jgi:hypothetical protein